MIKEFNLNLGVNLEDVKVLVIYKTDYVSEKNCIIFQTKDGSIYTYDDEIHIKYECKDGKVVAHEVHAWQQKRNGYKDGYDDVECSFFGCDKIMYIYKDGKVFSKEEIENFEENYKEEYYYGDYNTYYDENIYELNVYDIEKI